MTDPIISSSQSWNPEHYDEHARFVSTLGAAVFDLLDPEPGEHILDLGCGDGVLTEKLIAAGATVIGVDGDSHMVEGAKARGIDARLMDGQALVFENEFDAVFSNAALHWMTNPDAVSAGVFRALKPGGRYVAEAGGHGNVAAIRTALHAVLMRRGIEAEQHDPWYFPSPDEHEERLKRAGFEVDDIVLIPRPTPLPTDMTGWIGTFAKPFLHSAGSNENSRILEETVQLLEPALKDSYGRWTADYCRLRFKATKPAS